MKAKKKLFKITLKNFTDRYSEFYVIDTSMDSAYKTVRDYLDRNNLLFFDDRELKHVEVIAECCAFANRILFIDGKPYKYTPGED